MHDRTALALAIAITTAGCGGERTDPQPKADQKEQAPLRPVAKPALAPPTLQAVSQPQSLAMLTDGRNPVLAIDRDFRARLAVVGSPGSAAVIDGKRTTVDQTGRTEAVVDLAARFWNLQLKEVESGYGAAIRFEVTLVAADGKETKPPLRYLPHRFISDVFRTAANGGIKLPPGIKRTGPARALLVWRDRYSRPSSMNASGTLADVTRVAIGATLEPRKKRCGPYRSSRAGGRHFREASLTDVSVTLFHRESGKKLATQTFRASCPFMVFNGQYASSARHSSKISKWLKRQVR
jgi:hypothetical protein